MTKIVLDIGYGVRRGRLYEIPAVWERVVGPHWLIGPSLGPRCPFVFDIWRRTTSKPRRWGTQVHKDPWSSVSSVAGLRKKRNLMLVDAPYMTRNPLSLPELVPGTRELARITKAEPGSPLPYLPIGLSPPAPRNTRTKIPGLMYQRLTRQYPHFFLPRDPRCSDKEIFSDTSDSPPKIYNLLQMGQHENRPHKQKYVSTFLLRSYFPQTCKRD